MGLSCGENCFYAGVNERGDQTWINLEIHFATEGQIIRNLFSAYNESRTERDWEYIRLYEQETGDTITYNQEHGHFKKKFKDLNDFFKYVPGASQAGFLTISGDLLDVDEIKRLVSRP